MSEKMKTLKQQLEEYQFENEGHTSNLRRSQRMVGTKTPRRYWIRQ